MKAVYDSTRNRIDDLAELSKIMHFNNSML
jgi:hypothetical protein